LKETTKLERRDDQGLWLHPRSHQSKAFYHDYSSRCRDTI